jgi:adenosine deaminase
MKENPMTLNSFIHSMPKVELHVHLEGSISPETLLQMAQRHGILLPADTVQGLRQWYTFTDFDHFIEVYGNICKCIRTPDDVELVAREFLAGQAAQNIVYSEVTYTPYSQYIASGLPFADQLAAIERARKWAEKELNVYMGLVLDISRQLSPDEGMVTAKWAVEGMSDGVVALGLGGPEAGNPPEKFIAAFDLARSAGLHSVPHAGEIAGPESIWGALRVLKAERIGHGVNCLQDPVLVEELCRRQIPLEVCPTSNVCLKVVPDIESHPLPRLLAEGLLVTLNSDDPPMFNTTLTDEYLIAANVFHFGVKTIQKLVSNALRVSFLPLQQKIALEQRLSVDFSKLTAEHLRNL